MRGILLVTHNIEEAILMADRILIMDSNPGRIHHELVVNLPRPRDYELPAFRRLMDRIYVLMTAVSAVEEVGIEIDLSYRVPDVQVSEMAGLVEAIAEEEEGEDNTIEFSTLAELVDLDMDELLALSEVLNKLRFTKSQDIGIKLTKEGGKFASADLLEQKKIFARHLIQYIPLVKHICNTLRQRENQRVSKKYFLAELEDYFSDEDAERVLRTIIEWGRYAELFAYEDNSGKLSLENPE